MAAEREAMRIEIEGAVQGVGFRPFVYRLAQQWALAGQVQNTPGGVSIQVEGSAAQLEHFLTALHDEHPALAVIQHVHTEAVPPAGFDHFSIEHSQGGGQKTALVLPDIATCPDCLHEIFDPANRRYRYPFTNCTHCGPRYSIIDALPYDRVHTTMRHFTMCPECQAEYEDPLDRRFHAQPNACPVCGPHLELWDPEGTCLLSHDEALLAAADALRKGQILALKGLGGFQLLVDARNEQAVQRLRQRKQRPDKPFALMYPSLEQVRQDCAVSTLEADLLTSPAAPIVLLWGPDAPLAPAIAPGNPYRGVMLPYTPLHHLLMADLDFPVVATSGNLSDEPICIDNDDALRRLAEIADLFLLHDRPIRRQVDDSVVRVLVGQPQILRRARGYAPFPITLDAQLPAVLGLGAQQKNAVAAASGQQVFVSQHIGDLDNVESDRVFQRTIHDFETLYDWQPALIAHDLHPDYRSNSLCAHSAPA